MSEERGGAAMDLVEEGVSKLLFVSRRNLAAIVAAIAPDLVLVDRAAFTTVATQMLEIVERASK